MLRQRLAQLEAAKVKAVFFLGDGANNGCYDEFERGFGDDPDPASANDEGVLHLLDLFRSRTGIPVFFVMGNHDLLGAGSTSDEADGKKFCSDPNGRNWPLTKERVITLTDQFNRGNERFGGVGRWQYRSSYNAADISAACRASPAQHRNRGCYLAATADYIGGSVPVQFLLLDTNDWADVTDSTFFKKMQEGIRGAMSFRDEDGARWPSQIRWFERNASQPSTGFRLAVSHYDVASLRKALPILGRVSAKSGRFADLFVGPPDSAGIRQPLQHSAFVISGHTHVKQIDPKLFTFKLDCGKWRCQPTNQFQLRELNVGATTDFSSYATVAQFDLNPAGKGQLRYRRVDADSSQCRSLYDEIAKKRFPSTVRGKDVGWKALGVYQDYATFRMRDLEAVWQNLKLVSNSDPARVECIGLYAAAEESGVDPVRRPLPKVR